MVAFNPAFIDVDLEQEADKLQIPKGWLDPTPEQILHCSNYGDVEEEIPESQWLELYKQRTALKSENARLIRWLLNQRNEGSCVGNAGTQLLHVLSERQFPGRAIQLSAISAYKQIGFSANSGANIFDMLKKGIEVGILPLDIPENRARFGDHVMPATGFSTRWPNGWQSTAKHFRYGEFHRIKGRRQGFTALFKGHPILVGRAGHSILYLDPIWDGVRWLIMYVNSWGNWGQGFGIHPAGFGFDSVRLFESALSSAYTVRSVRIPPWEAEAITPLNTAL